MADLVEIFSVDDINALLKGKGELQIIKDNPTPKATGAKQHHLMSDESYSEVTEKLRAFKTRETGMELLISTFPTKESTEKFARFLDLPVHKTDSIELLREKIVEAEIGSKLRSYAVQGRKSS